MFFTFRSNISSIIITLSNFILFTFAKSKLSVLDEVLDLKLSSVLGPSINVGAFQSLEDISMAFIPTSVSLEEVYKYVGK